MAIKLKGGRKMNAHLNEEQKLTYFMYLSGTGLDSIDADELCKIEDILFKNQDYYEEIKKDYQIVKKILDLKLKNQINNDFLNSARKEPKKEEMDVLIEYFKNSPPPTSSTDIQIKHLKNVEEDEALYIVKLKISA
jgi:hypothetical protein